MTIMDKLNSGVMYLIVGAIIVFVTMLCVVFMVRAYRAGKAMGLDTVKMKRAISASATFAVLPSIGILLGVIALSGSLGIPLPWFRLSVIGALHYETQVAQAAAEQVGISLSASQMTEKAFLTIALLMGFCICWGMVLSIIFTKKYAKKLTADIPAEGEQVVSADNTDAVTADATANATGAGTEGETVPAAEQTPEKEQAPKKKKKFSITDFGDSAMTAMFIGLVSAYIGSYITNVVKGDSWLPLAVAAVGALAMAVFMWLKEKKKAEWVDNFSIAGSMIIAMASAVLFNTLL